MTHTQNAWNWTQQEDSIGRPSSVYKRIEYPPQGFHQDLGRHREESAEIIRELKANRWLTRATRAVLIDFSVYNANINLFCVIQLMVELPPTGGLLTSQEFKTVKLLKLKGKF